MLHAILHAILFHRLFGTVKPQTFEVLDVTVVSYVVIIDIGLVCNTHCLCHHSVLLCRSRRSANNQKMTARRFRSRDGAAGEWQSRYFLEGHRERHEQAWSSNLSPFIFCFQWCLHPTKVLVTFSEKRPKKSWFQVYVGEEDIPWEQWCGYVHRFCRSYTPFNRIVNAEMRQPKTDKGACFLRWSFADILIILRSARLWLDARFNIDQGPPSDAYLYLVRTRTDRGSPDHQRSRDITVSD